MTLQNNNNNMGINFKEIKVAFFDNMAKKLEPMGFKYKKSSEPEFIIKTPFGNQYVQFFILYGKGTYCKIEVHFGVGFTKLSEISNKHRVPFEFRERKANEKRSNTVLATAMKDLHEDYKDYEIILFKLEPELDMYHNYTPLKQYLQLFIRYNLATGIQSLKNIKYELRKRL